MSEEVISLPPYFKQLEYLESTGSQYIDTGYIPTNTTGFWVDAEQITHSNGVPVGSGCDRNSPADAMMPPRWLKSTNNSAGFGWGGWYHWGNISNGGRFISKLNFYNDKKAYLETSGEKPQQFSRDLGELPFTPTKSTLFFKTSVNAGVADYNWYGRIYEVKITQDTEIIRDFIPAYDKVLEKPCMFDLVTQTAYYNQGSGEFTYYYEEPIVSIPYGYKRCAFLESTGTQYIDTQIAATSSHGLWADVLGTSSEDRNIFGCSHIETVDGVEQITSLALPKNNSTHSYSYGLSQGTFTEDSTYYNKRYTKFTNYLNSKLAGLQTLNSFDTPALIEEEFELESNIFLFTNNETIRNEDGTISSTMGPMVGGIISNTFIGKIYRAKITHEENVIADFIPCLDTDGRPCMYDVVRQQTFYNTNNEGYDFSYQVENRLPRRYKRLQWLESVADKQGIIDTGITGNSNIRFDIDYMPLSNYSSIFGSRESSSNKEIQLSNWASTLVRLGTNYAWTCPLKLNERAKITYLNDTINHSNGSSVTITRPAWENNYDIYLFILNEKNNLTQGSKNRIYYCKFYNLDKLIRHFIPAYDTEEQRPCMYDLVDGRAYYNAGTGEFNYPTIPQETNYTGFCQLGVIGNRLGTGEDGLPYGYTRLNYLESRGTQWIDTKMRGYQNLRFYADVQMTRRDTCIPFGAEDTDGGIGYALHLNEIYTSAFRYSSRNYWKNNLPCNNTTRGVIIFDDNILSDAASNYSVTVSQPPAFTTIYNISLFKTERPNGGQRTPIKIFALKFWDNLTKEVIRDFVPCLDFNGRPCMYDKISRKTFYNQGTGEFLYG